jgi:hypothetical protein
MIEMTKLRNALFCAMALASVVAFAGQDNFLLRRSLKEGATETYALESKTKQVVTLPNGMGEQEVSTSTSSTYAVKVGKVDEAKHAADVEVTITIDKIEIDSPMGDPSNSAGDAGKKTTMKGTLDHLGKLVLPPPTNPNDPMTSVASMANSIGLQLPEKAVKVGDTWEVVLPKNPFMGDQEQKLTARVVGETTVKDRPALKVAMDGTLNLNVDMTKMLEKSESPMAGQKMFVKGTAEFKMVGLIDRETGQTLESTTETLTKQTIEMPDMGISMASTGTGTTTMKLK